MKLETTCKELRENAKKLQTNIQETKKILKIISKNDNYRGTQCFQEYGESIIS